MDALGRLFDLIKKKGLVEKNLLGFLHVMIGRRIARPDGTLLSSGLPWRDLAGRLKKIRLDPELVRELNVNPDDLPPRDRQRFWFLAISKAQVDSPEALEAGELFATKLRAEGYQVGSAARGSPEVGE